MCWETISNASDNVGYVSARLRLYLKTMRFRDVEELGEHHRTAVVLRRWPPSAARAAAKLLPSEPTGLVDSDDWYQLMLFLQDMNEQV